MSRQSSEISDESWGLDNVAVYVGPTLPTVTFGAQNQYAAVGETARFAVQAAGTEPLSCQWYFRDNLLLGQTNITLSITNVRPTHAGSYSVRISNALGFVMSQPVSLTVFTAAPDKLWEFSTPGGISGPPALGRDGTIYFGSANGSVYALDPTGSNTWSFLAGAPVVDSPCVGVSDQIYFGSRGGWGLHALKANGSTAWGRGAGGWVDGSPALAADETIYAGSHDGSLYSFLPNGLGQWARPTGGWIGSSPGVGGTGVIYIGSPDGRLYAMTASGASRWSFLTTGVVDSSPAIGSDGTIYVGSSDKRLYAISPNGTNRWFFSTGGAIESSPALGVDGTIYFGSGDKKLYAINPDGTEKWEFATDVPVTSSPAVAADGTICFGPVSGNVFALNPDGTVKWVFPAGVGIFGASPMLTLDGTLYVCGGYKLYALRMSSGLAQSSWPMFRHDPRHTGNAGQPFQFPPTLTSPGRQGNGSYSFDLYGEMSQTYEIDVSPDLSSWTVLTNVFTTDFHTPILDPAAAQFRQRFYRALVP